MEGLIIAKKEDLQRVLDDALDEAVPRLLKEMKPPKEPAKSWLSNREAQEFLDVSKSTLQRWRHSGVLPFSKVEGSVYYRREDLDRILEQGRVDS